MAEVVSDIIVTQASVWYAPVGEANPADTVAAEGDWGGNWVNLGWTATSLSMAVETGEVDIDIQQSLTPVNRVKSAENVMLETTLAEFYLDGIQLAMSGGTVTDTAAGAGQPGKEEFDLGGVATLDKYKWGFEGTYVDEDDTEFPIRVFIHKATVTVNGNLEFGKAVQTGIPLQIKPLADMSQAKGERLLKIQKILEPAT
jgi:hypothetical protein